MLFDYAKGRRSTPSIGLTALAIARCQYPGLHPGLLWRWAFGPVSLGVSGLAEPGHAVIGRLAFGVGLDGW